MRPSTTSAQVGNQKALERLGGWKGVEEWESSRRGVWLSDGKGDDDGGHRRPIGYAKVGRGRERGPPVLYVVLTPCRVCIVPRLGLGFVACASLPGYDIFWNFGERQIVILQCVCSMCGYGGKETRLSSVNETVRIDICFALRPLSLPLATGNIYTCSHQFIAECVLPALATVRKELARAA